MILRNQSQGWLLIYFPCKIGDLKGRIWWWSAGLACVRRSEEVKAGKPGGRRKAVEQQQWRGV